MSLDIRVLGDLTVLRAGEAVSLPPSRKTRALLAYLAMTDRPQRRERLRLRRTTGVLPIVSRMLS